MGPIWRAKEAEEELKAQENIVADVERLTSAGIPLVIYHVSFIVNSAGGVEPRIIFLNISSKTIKYTTFNLKAFNAVGDPANGRISDNANNIGIKLVGPIRPRKIGTYDFEN